MTTIARQIFHVYFTRLHLSYTRQNTQHLGKCAKRRSLQNEKHERVLRQSKKTLFIPRTISADPGEQTAEMPRSLEKSPSIGLLSPLLLFTTGLLHTQDLEPCAWSKRRTMQKLRSEKRCLPLDFKSVYCYIALSRRWRVVGFKL